MSVIDSHENKKYRLTDVSRMHEGTEVFQIESLVDMSTQYGDVKKGELGGFIESEYNLVNDANDLSWVGNRSAFDSNGYRVDMAGVVKGDSLVEKGGHVAGGAVVSGDSLVSRSLVHENSIVENSKLTNNSYSRMQSVIVDSNVDKADIKGSLVAKSNISDTKLEYAVSENSRVNGAIDIGTHSTLSHSSIEGGKVSMENNIINSKLINPHIEEGHKINNVVAVSLDVVSTDIESEVEYDQDVYDNLINKYGYTGYGKKRESSITNDDIIVTEDGRVIDKATEYEVGRGIIAEQPVKLTEDDLVDLNNLEDSQGINR